MERRRKKTNAKAGQCSAAKPLPKSVKKSSKPVVRAAILAKHIKRNLVQKNIPKKLQESWDVANENSKAYELSKETDFFRMLSIVAQYGGVELARLATEKVEDDYDEVPLLIAVLRDAEDRKHFITILDEFLKFFIEFAKQKDGSEYSTGSMRIMIRRIFAYMGNKYDLKVTESDFGTEGTFRARLSDIWTEERKINPDFGRLKGKSEICLHDVEYVHDAIRDGVLQPRTNPNHLKLVVSFIFLRLFALRTAEVANLDLKDIRWKTYDFGPDQGKKYVELYVDINKVNKLKLGNWKTPPNYGKLKLRDNPEDTVFNAYSYLEFYLSKLGKKAKGR